jgi:beta-mannosidase
MLRYLDGGITELDQGWSVAVTAAGAWSDPDDFVESDFIAAIVPGTVAAALAAVGRFDPANPVPLQDKDAWYRCRLTAPAGPAVLRFSGLATRAEVFLNGASILHNQSMFVATDATVELTGDDQLVISFPALTPALAARGPRARWRPQLFDSQGLRLIRTTLLGHMPGWCPSIQAVGPYRRVQLIRPGAISLDDVRISTEVSADGLGILTVTGTGPDGLSVRCGGVEAPLVPTGEHLQATVTIPTVQPWWPATHGNPMLYDIEVVSGDASWLLARTGFRTLEIDAGDGDDFAIRINGESVFCRGAVWTNADLLGLGGSREDYAPLLEQVAAAGLNMVRIPGIATYETAAFFDLCDELGILVFQDFMFANFDYPFTDEGFAAQVHTEVSQFLADRQGCPSLAVVCAGSEIAQQAAMLGLPEHRWYSSFATETLPALVTRWRTDVGFVPGSPSGGPLPFSVDAGIGHYYGVGAYERPLTDARRAGVRFTTECLAFANVPEASNLPRALSLAPVHHPGWKAGVPRDPGASWDFEDIRDHYLAELYGLDPAALRRVDPAGYLDFSRAATAEVITEAFAEWRRSGSSCRGALVFTLVDLRPGAGWGLLDSDHRPKAAFRALARASRPVSVALTDEGVNGLRVHVINDTAETTTAKLEIFGLRDGAVPVAAADRGLIAEPRSAIAIAATELLGGFFDYNYAYRFGAASHDVVVARLRIDGRVAAEAYAFPRGRQAAITPSELHVDVIETESTWALRLNTDRFAQSVHLSLVGYAADEDWFHLTPAEPRIVTLTALPGTAPRSRPSGEARSLAGSSTSF